MSTCAICVEDTESPVCCVPCGHVYCRECIGNWQKSKKSVSKCPECREKIQDIMAIYIKRDDSKDEVKELIVKNEELQRKSEDANQINIKLEEEQKRTIIQLDQQMKQTAVYQVQVKVDRHVIEGLQNKIQNMESRWLMKILKKTDKVTSYVSNFITTSRRKLCEVIAILCRLLVDIMEEPEKWLCLLTVPIITLLNKIGIIESSFSYEHLVFLMVTVLIITIMKFIYKKLTRQQTISEQTGLSTSRNVSPFHTYYRVPSMASIPYLKTPRERNYKNKHK